MNNFEKIKEYEAHKTPVPTFEEWQASYNCMLENEVLRLKNAQLKELLKECFIAINQGSFWDECKVLHKIEQALGEDK